MEQQLNINGVSYYYEKNLQGDVVGLVDNQGNTLVTYSYDAWENVTKVATIMCTALAIVIVGIIAYYTYKFANGLTYATSRGKGVKFSFKWGRLSWKLI